MSMRVPEPLRRFIWDIQSMVELADDPREILMIGADLMRRLVARDDWLPPDLRAAGSTPRLYKLYHDEMERFCVVASALGEGQGWPLFSDQTWEICGVLAGALQRRSFVVPGEGAPQAVSEGRQLAAGEIATARAREGQASEIRNSGVGAMLSIHVFGADIGTAPRLSIGADGVRAPLVLGYANPDHAPAFDILSIQADIVD